VSFDRRDEQALRRPRRWWLWALCLLAAAALAGCGSGRGTTRSTGSGGTTSSTTSGASQGDPSSRSATVVFFKLEVERKCKAGNLMVRKNVHAKKGNTLAGIAELTVYNQKVERKVVSELEQAKPPAELASAMKSIIGYRRALADELTAFAAIISKNDKAKLPPISQAKTQLRAQLAKAGKKTGLKECAKVG
jgi:hypothetical protein